MVEPSVFLSSGDGYVEELLELPQGWQGSVQGSRGKVGFLLRSPSRIGPHLALRAVSPGFSRVVAGNLGFLSSYDGDLRDPLMLPQESPVHVSCDGPLGIPLKLLLGQRSSSGFEAVTSGFCLEPAEESHP